MPDSVQAKAAEPDSFSLGTTLKAWLRGAFVDNFALKFVALVLALTIFILVHSDENEVYHPWVRVTYSEDEGRVLTSKRVDQVQISVRGSRRRIKRLQKERLEGIFVDLGALSTGEFRFEPEMFGLPEGVELISVHPPSLNLEFDERVTKRVSVEVDTIGVPARGYKIGGIRSTPASVEIIGGKKRLAEVNTIATTKVNLTGRTQSFQGVVDLIVDGFEVSGAPNVNAEVDVLEELEARRTGEKMVELRAPAGLKLDQERFRVEPESVRVTIYGSVTALEALDEAAIAAYVQLSAPDLLGSVNRRVEVKIEPSLSDVAYKVSPAAVNVRAVPREAQ